MIRLFVAIGLPHATCVDLAMMCGGGMPGARWVPMENYHITLRFIGEVSEPQADDIDSALASLSVKPFDLQIKGCGVFGQDQPRALWAGIEPNEALTNLQKKIERVFQQIGLAPDKRKFAPHITLARLRNADPLKVQQFIQDHSLYKAPPIAIDSFGLYSSDLSHSGSIYHLEQSYTLARVKA
jgi:2'-5' RNA ligase